MATIISVFALLGLHFDAMAHPLSKEECREGSDFIKNAALSRDNGLDGMTFVTKMLGDLAAIRSFPAEIRWFAQDREDEELLINAAVAVFEHPQDPEIHRRRFLGNCVAITANSLEP